ncbi:hypothetical protein [Acidipila sp. EB88]|uniref:hypothetical protein n=1 Tax=Acidipila sp. EB88 TaxID=2305226 RepID=UPI000F5E5905|nr:hypothetical protein [Acidipila sp. EB88]
MPAATPRPQQQGTQNNSDAATGFRMMGMIRLVRMIGLIRMIRLAGSQLPAASFPCVWSSASRMQQSFNQSILPAPGLPVPSRADPAQEEPRPPSYPRRAATTPKYLFDKTRQNPKKGSPKYRSGPPFMHHPQKHCINMHRCFCKRAQNASKNTHFAQTANDQFF